jgi:hypothetical protein
MRDIDPLSCLHTEVSGCTACRFIAKTYIYTPPKAALVVNAVSTHGINRSSIATNQLRASISAPLLTKSAFFCRISSIFIQPPKRDGIQNSDARAEFSIL